MVKELAELDHLPDYRIALDDNMVLFRNRLSMRAEPAAIRYPILDTLAYLQSKQVAPGYDVYFLEQE